MARRPKKDKTNDRSQFCSQFGIREEIGAIALYRFRLAGFSGRQRDLALHETEQLDLSDMNIGLRAGIERTEVEAESAVDRLHAITLTWVDEFDFSQMTEPLRTKFFDTIRHQLIDHGEGHHVWESIRDDCHIVHELFFEALKIAQDYMRLFAKSDKETDRKTFQYPGAMFEEAKADVTLARGKREGVKIPKQHCGLDVEIPSWFKSAARTPGTCVLHGIVPVCNGTRCVP